ncbi:hypothetical protein ATANTOWER_004461 [Ataeniobius toweri]|uniref:Uncharacterized protein n=1 Tax=Ataeniobius toweri TaxID=208326 RepID=A0ABU7AEK0_9TELE|nr:hypothetical protein [Ataeniobius toweri]
MDLKPFHGVLCLYPTDHQPHLRPGKDWTCDRTWKTHDSQLFGLFSHWLILLLKSSKYIQLLHPLFLT